MTASHSRTLLLVEDERLVALAEKRTLERFGYRVLVASSGEDAVEAVKENPAIDLVLMDIDLGEGIDGTEAAERILALRELPLVFLSGHTEPEYVERTEGITSYGYIVKNSGDTVLDASIKMAFRLFEAHQRLKDSETFQRTVIDGLPLPLVSVDRDDKVTVWNPAAERVFGWSKEEVLGKPAPYFPARELPSVEANRDRLVAGESIQGAEAVRTTKDGNRVDVRLYLSPICDDGGTVTGAVGALEEIGEQKKAQRALQREKTRFERLFQRAPMAIALLDSTERIVECNRQFVELFGYAPDEAQGQQIADLIVPAELKSDGEAVSREVIWNPDGRYYETQRRRKDATLVDVAVTGAPLEIDGQPYTYAIYEDITARNSAYQSLQQARRRYQDLFEAAPIPMWLDDFSELKRRLDQIQAVAGGDLRAYLSARPQLLRELAAEVRILDVNQRALQLYEAPDKDEFCAEGIAATFCEQSYETFLEELLLIAEGNTRFSIEIQHVTHRGTPLEVELHWAVAPGSEDSCEHVHVSVLDITERKRAERELHESEAMSRSIAEDGFDVVLLLSLEGEFLYVNHAAGQALDLPVEEIVRHLPLEFVHRPDRPIVVRAFRELQLGSVHVRPPAYRLVTRNGELAWWDSRGTMLFNDAGEPEKILVIGRDITRYKQSEERITSLLREKDLLLKETHHRIKNHMSVIAGYLRYQAESRVSEEHRRILREAASRAQGLMILYDRLYRTHERGSLSIREYLPPLVEETVRLLEHGVPVTVSTQVEDFLLESRTLGVLGIMVTELITNSIKHGFREGASGRITVAAQQQGNSAILQYSDSGVGMPAEQNPQQDQAKPNSDSATDGFGLQLIALLVEQIGGTYAVSTRNGTSYRIEFRIP